MNKIIGLVGGIGIGVALMYILDPERGARRRALFRDKAVGLKNDLSDIAEKRAVDMRNRAKGMLHEAKSAFSNDKTEEALPEGGHTF